MSENNILSKGPDMTVTKRKRHPDVAFYVSIFFITIFCCGLIVYLYEHFGAGYKKIKEAHVLRFDSKSKKKNRYENFRWK
jgi:hypothetical protein